MSAPCDRCWGSSGWIVPGKVPCSACGMTGRVDDRIEDDGLSQFGNTTGWFFWAFVALLPVAVSAGLILATITGGPR